MAMDLEVAVSNLSKALGIALDKIEALSKLGATLASQQAQVAKQNATLATANRDLAEQVVELMDWKLKVLSEQANKEADKG